MGRTFASEILWACFREGLFSKGLIIEILWKLIKVFGKLKIAFRHFSLALAKNNHAFPYLGNPGCDFGFTS